MGERKVVLKIMDDEKFKKYYDYAVSNYAEEKAKSGNWKEEEALKLAKDTFNKMLPDKQDTENNYMYSIFNENDDHIGFIWFIDEKGVSFLADIILFEDFRGNGYGNLVMKKLEDKSKELGAKKIELHVFGHNKVAFNLYKKMGFNVTNYRMAKEL